MNKFYLEKNFKNKLAEIVEENISLDKESFVLNIACEYELVPDFLKSKVDSKNVFGVEVNKEIVSRVKNIKYCDVDKNYFPFKNDTFDLVVSIWGIEHFKKENIFKEAKRVLKNKGVFVFIVPNLFYPIFLINKLMPKFFSKFYYKHIMKSEYSPHKTYYKYNNILKLKKISSKYGLDLDLHFLGPANILNYFSFSKFFQKLIWLFEKCINNRFLFFFKPYIIGIMSKK